MLYFSCSEQNWHRLLAMLYCYGDREIRQKVWVINICRLSIVCNTMLLGASVNSQDHGNSHLSHLGKVSKSSLVRA